MKRFLSAMMVLIVLSSAFACSALADGRRRSGLFTYEIKGNGTAIITDFDWGANNNGDIYVPSMIDGYTVTNIANNAFSKSYKNGVRKIAVVLPNTITQIGEQAFFDCNNIASINIPASVQVIGAGALAGLADDIKFTVDSNSSTFATIDGVLYNKMQKELISCPDTYLRLPIPEGILSVGDYAFYKCEIQTLTLPSTLTKIGNYAFAYSKMPRMVLPSNLTTIGDYAFYDAIWFTPVEISGISAKCLYFPSKVSKIGEGAFSECKAGDNAVMDYYRAIIFDNNNTLTELPIRCFEGVTFSTSTRCIWPTSLTKVGDYAFYGTDICESNDFILPSTLKEIGAYAFSDTKMVETFVIPNGVETLGEGCFLNKKEYLFSDLTELVIPATVTSIGDNICDRTKVSLCVEAGSYAALWASENGYPTTNAGGDDTSWLN